jgi:hypothetical protein
MEGIKHCNSDNAVQLLYLAFVSFGRIFTKYLMTIQTANVTYRLFCLKEPSFSLSFIIGRSKTLTAANWIAAFIKTCQQILNYIKGDNK